MDIKCQWNVIEKVAFCCFLLIRFAQITALGMHIARAHAHVQFDAIYFKLFGMQVCIGKKEDNGWKNASNDDNVDDKTGPNAMIKWNFHGAEEKVRWQKKLYDINIWRGQNHDFF